MARDALKLERIKKDRHRRSQVEPSIHADDSLIPAASFFAGSFNRLAGSVAGLTVLCLICGYIEVSAYLTALGAPWAVEMMSPARLIQRGGTQMLFLLLLTICIFLFYSQWAIRNVTLLWVTLIGASFVLAALPFQSWVGSVMLPQPYYALARALRFIGLATAACSVVVTIGALSGTKLKWQIHHILVVLLGLIVGLVFGPAFLGEARATRDTNIRALYLPFVSAPGLDSSRNWLLVSPLDASFLVMSFGKKPTEHIFRVVTAGELGEVRRTLYPKEGLLVPVLVNPNGETRSTPNPSTQPAKNAR